MTRISSNIKRCVSVEVNDSHSDSNEIFNKYVIEISLTNKQTNFKLKGYVCYDTIQNLQNYFIQWTWANLLHDCPIRIEGESIKFSLFQEYGKLLKQILEYFVYFII